MLFIERRIKLKIKSTNYSLEYKREEKKSPFRGTHFINHVILKSEYETKFDIKLSDPFMKGLYKNLVDLFRNNFPFYVELPPISARESYCVSGEYDPNIGYKLHKQFTLCFCSRDTNNKLTAEEVKLSYEELCEYIIEIESDFTYSNVFKSEEMLDFDCIDISYYESHRFNRNMFGSNIN